jgi:hypothetical protein
MAGTSWPSLAAGQKARGADVEAKFDWIEGNIVPMNAGAETTGAYDLGTTSAKWRTGYFLSSVIVDGRIAVGTASTQWTGVFAGSTNGIIRIYANNKNATAGQERRSLISMVGNGNTEEVTLLAGRDAADNSYQMISGANNLQFGISAVEVGRVNSTEMRINGNLNVGLANTTATDRIHTPGLVRMDNVASGAVMTGYIGAASVGDFQLACNRNPRTGVFANTSQAGGVINFEPTGAITTAVYTTNGASVVVAMTINPAGTIKFANGTSINEFSTDGTLGGDSDLAVPTEKAVKAYVDAELSGTRLSQAYTQTSNSPSTVGTLINTVTVSLPVTNGAVLILAHARVYATESYAPGPGINSWLSSLMVYRETTATLVGMGNALIQGPEGLLTLTALDFAPQVSVMKIDFPNTVTVTYMLRSSGTASNTSLIAIPLNFTT